MVEKPEENSLFGDNTKSEKSESPLFANDSQSSSGDLFKAEKDDFSFENHFTTDTDCWKILIVDDEDGVHTVTMLALKSFEFQNKKVHFYHAFSKSDAREILLKDPTIALILLDVVMETNNSGLELVRYIREELKNDLIRIVLRTGHPGDAPEREVVQRYEINDYRTKTELTQEKLFTIIISSLRAFDALQTVHRYSQELEEKVEQRTHELHLKNKSITDSIRYAFRIQQAFLPSERMMKRLLPDSFIVYLPKDIVSGDFFWAGKAERNTNGRIHEVVYFTAIDCTGHGVPGAFMSIVANYLLNQALNDCSNHSPSAILNYLSKGVYNSLRRSYDDATVKAGMDLALCALDRDGLKLWYAGVHNPLYILRGTEVLQFKPDFHPIGEPFTDEFKSYNSQEIDLQPGDVVYVFSDGLVDQPGGDKRKRYRSDRFRELLCSFANLPLEQQKEKMMEVFDTWKGDIEQYDDVLVMGVRI